MDQATVPVYERMCSKDAWVGAVCEICRSYYQITPDGQPDAVSETPNRGSRRHLKLCQPW